MQKTDDVAGVWEDLEKRIFVSEADSAASTHPPKDAASSTQVEGCRWLDTASIIEKVNSL
jgi:hypothetical protein